MILFEKQQGLRYSRLSETLLRKDDLHAQAQLEQAQEALAKVEAHMETLTPQTQARHMAERVRDNLAACIAMAQCNPKAGEILMPNVLTAAHEYLSGLGKN